MTRMFRMAQAVVLVAACAVPATAAQSSATPTQADIQKLQDGIYLAERDLTQLRTRDAARASELSSELSDLQDEVIYQKVKLRKDHNLTRAEYRDLSDRIQDVRARAQGTTPSSSTASSATRGAVPGATTGTATARPQVATPAPAPAPRASTARNALEVPAGTELDVRMITGLNSGTAQVEDRFEATAVDDLVLDDRTVVPAGSAFRGVVSSVDPATRTNRTGKLTVTFDQMTVNGRTYPIRGTVTQALESSGIKGEAGKIGAGAGVGAIIGGLLGGVKGALAGILIGGGGTIAATEGKDVDLPQGTVLRVRIESPVQLR